MNDENTRRLFKKLTAKNWRQHDRTNSDEWATEILETELDSTVPEDVRNLFEVAQGVLCYGCYFYPLYMLGLEQLFRVMEAAVSHRCADLDAPKQANNFWKKLKWLQENSHLSEQEHAQWDVARNLRNMWSHADQQFLLPPAAAIRHMQVTAKHINGLFCSTEEK